MAQLSPAARAFLEERRFSIFADINADGTPHLTVLWYALEGEVVMFNTAQGRVKDKNLHRDNRASVCVEDGDRYVTINGACTLQGDDQEAAQADILSLAIRYEGEEAGRKMAADFRNQERETIRLSIESVDEHGF